VNLTEKVITEIAHAPVAAGATDVTDCKVIDMQNFDAVRFVVGFGAITAGAATSINAKQADAKSSDTALTNGQDLAGTKVTVPDDGDSKLYVLDIVRPQKRYVQLLIKRATQNAVVDLAIAEKYHARKLPVTQSADVNAHEIHASPAEGTA
jgi:hypothetical protein